MKSNGMPPEQWPYTVAIDDINPNIMYVSTKNGQNKGFCHRNEFCGVVMKSTDGGESWFKIMNGLDDKNEFYTLLIYPPDHNILFLSTSNGVYLSKDAGNSWEGINNGLPVTRNQVRDNVADNLALTPDNKNLIFGLMNYGVWKADLSSFAPPEITSFAPPSPVNDTVGATRTFSITINQTVNVSWQINGTEVQTNASVTEASYTNMSAVVGSWNVSVIVTNTNGTDMQTWIWKVTKAVGNPDLIITEKWLCWPDNCTICYNVTNTGDGTAPACHNTALYVDGVEVAHDHVPVDLAPGESYTGCFDDYTWTYTPPSDNITVCADNNEALDELDEDNNCLTNIWMCGDVNCDGKVTMSDVRKVFNRYLDPNYPLDLPWAADVNCDGKVTMSDVRNVFNRYLDPGYGLNCCCEGLG